MYSKRFPHSSLTSSASTLMSCFRDDMKCYLHSGNYVAPSGPVTCLNPTLLFTIHDELQVKISGFPFDAYVPVPFEKQLVPGFESIKEEVYSYCKSKLQEMVTILRARKNRVTFYFHFGDCLELCLRKEEMKKKFEVIHCSCSTTEKIGYANIISACYSALSGPDAVLLTNILLIHLHVKWQLSVLEYIESSLCYPLSMIPTLYGV